MQWVWRHCRQATWGPSARWQTQRATEGCSVYMFLMFLYLDIIFISFKKKFPCWIPRGSDLKTAHLGMRTPGHTPALSGINSDSLLQTSVQHREVRQEVSKLANISKTIRRKREIKDKDSLKIPCWWRPWRCIRVDWPQDPGRFPHQSKHIPVYQSHNLIPYSFDKPHN